MMAERLVCRVVAVVLSDSKSKKERCTFLLLRRPHRGTHQLPLSLSDTDDHIITVLSAILTPVFSWDATP
jgi:hypothetical protein